MASLTGDWQTGQADLLQAIDLAREVGSVFGEVLSAQRLALLESRLGRHDEAHSRLLAARELAAGSDDMLVKVHTGTRVLGTLAHNRLEAGRTAEAADYLAQGFAAQQEVGECSSCDVLLYPAAVPIYIELQDLEQAEWAVTKAEEVASTFRSRTWIASAQYLRGLLAKAHGDSLRAQHWLQQAADGFRSLPQPYEAGQAVEALAGITTSESRIALLQEAAMYYERLGAKPAAQRVQSHLAAAR